MKQEAPPSPTQTASRGSHAARSSTMRQRLIEAAISCLCRVGYAATTTQRVMDEAGVSRGAMLHHFPTKVDLMIAVSEYAADQQDKIVRQRLGAKWGSNFENYMRITGAVWEAFTEPPALALIEIMTASRSDPALHERFPAVAQRIESVQQAQVFEMARAIGIEDEEIIGRMVRLHAAAMRGLAMEVIFTGNRQNSDSAVELLHWYKRKLTGELITLHKDDDTDASATARIGVVPLFNATPE